MPTNAQILWSSALAFSFAAGWTDLRTRKIPNWLTVSGFGLGVALHIWMNGFHGLLGSLEGAGLALGLLLPLVLMRALGAGDWKLMGAIGAFLGPMMFLFVLVGSILVNGVVALVEMMRTRRVRETFNNLRVLVQGFFTFGLRANPKISLDNPELLKLPFGVAVAIATVACYCAARWGL